MSRILFTHSYFLRFDPKQWKLQQPYAPLGTISAAALMRSHGFEVNLHDNMFRVSPEEIEEAISKITPGYLVIYDDGFNYLTKMCLTNMREAAFRMIEIGKQHGCKVIVSSSDATDHAEEYLKKGADFVIAGEAEISLLELINAHEKSQEYNAIPGIIFKHESKMVKTAPRPVMQHLDELPIAAWDLVEMKQYRERWIKKNGYFSINIATTRGCPYKCNWCAKPIYGNRYNSRSPRHVINELLYLDQIIGFDHVWFCDDIFGLKPGWIEEFNSLLDKNNLHFKFKIQSRADILLKENTLKNLAAAGCDTIWIGAESGSQRILDAMDKGITVAQIYEVTKKIKASKMKPAFFLQLGYLGETTEDVEATLKMLADLMPDDIGVSVSYPLPGTKFYDKVKDDLTAKANWTDSDDLAMMFRNTYQPAYYKVLHRLIHKKFRKMQALETLNKMISGKQSFTGENIYKAASSVWYIPAEAYVNYRLKQHQR
jgi:anaerobic magnesium-protoporphyrin IX monomethyl ester cyclase